MSASTEKITFSRNDLIAKAHARVSHIFFLQEGELEYFLIDEVTEEKTTLFQTNKTRMIIGWEALNPPGRYISNIAVKSQRAMLKKCPVEDFMGRISTTILSDICQQQYALLGKLFYYQTGLLSDKLKQRAVHVENYYLPQKSSLEERITLLRSSPFFGEFEDYEIASIANLLQRREYESGERIFEQDESTEGIYVLIQGEVSIRRQEDDVYLNFRSISTPGYIFGWSSAFGVKDICRASAERKTSLYFIPIGALAQLLAETSFGITFFKMVLWLLSNQLQLAHSRFLHLIDDHELISVKQLIDMNRPSIPLPSPLHQIPHLLKDLSTQSLAFSILHSLHDEGSKQERHLASICLDLLVSEEREMKFVESIRSVYNAVSSADPSNVSENRKLCAMKTKQVLDNAFIHLEGMENLPGKSGHIFIYNHLMNHPQYLVENKFHFTLDSHFISSMILNERYGDPGIRTVRIGKSAEYGHQDYYENLGYINVFTKESDLQDEATTKMAKERFYQEAEGYLANGHNVIISPEGTSFLTEESPGPFKMGPFRLASQVSVEPFIVPIVMCNFDKRITETVLYCKILKPFKISEKKAKRDSLHDFVQEYQIEFGKEVANARHQANLLLNQLRKK